MSSEKLTKPPTELTETEQHRDTLLWLSQMTANAMGRSPSWFQPGGYVPTLHCNGCGHGIEHHDDDGDCMFPRSIGAPHRLCDCGKFLTPVSG